MSKGLKHFFSIFALVAVCFAGGYAIGKAVNAIMNKIETSKAVKAGYIGKPQISTEEGILTPEILHSLGYMSDPRMSPDEKTILYGISYSSVEKNSTVRNLYICNADGSNPRQLTRSAKSINNARWNSDGSEIWFIRGGQICRAGYRNGRLSKIQTLSDVPEGIGEFAFSPDFESIMYISSIPGPVKTPSQIDPSLDKANAYVAEGLMYRHWDHWVTETPRTYICKLGKDKISKDSSIDILGNEPYELPTEPFGGLEQLSWSPDGRYIAYSCRKVTGAQYAFSTNTDIFIYDILTGATTPVTCGGGYDTDPVWSPDGSKLAWVSMERDGYEADKQRLMLAEVHFPAPAEGQSSEIIIDSPRDLTASLDADAASPVWSPDGRNIYFNATEMGLEGIYCVAAEGPAKAVRLTSMEWLNNFGGVFAFGAEGTLYTSVQSMMAPSELAILNPAETEFTCISHINDDVLGALGKIRVERLAQKTAQGETLYSWVLYPDGFDPAKTYPVVEMFNGGPQSCLDQSWSKRWNFRLMAEQGYVVLLPNRHGCSGFGQAWKEQISGDYQGLNMQDYLLAASWAKSQPWCGKIAGVGASYGGFSVYNMAGIHNGMFDCFIAHAGIFDINAMWYTTEESWFTNWDNGGLGKGESWGGIQQGGAPYSKLPASVRQYAQSPDKKITKWDTPILCIHGMLDFRIPYEQGMAAFNAAQMMGVPSKLVVFPEENHWIVKPQNCIFWQEEFFSWLEQWCK